MSEFKNQHPLARFMGGIAIIATTFMLFWSVIQHFPWLAVFIGLTTAILVAWKPEIVETPAFKTIGGATLVLLAVSTGLIKLYETGGKTASLYFGIEERWGWMIVTIIGLRLISLGWRLANQAGLPGNPDKVDSICWGFTGIATILIGAWIYFVPVRGFDQETGDVKIYKTASGEIGYASGSSQTTGEEFKLVSKDEAKEIVKRQIAARTPTPQPAMNSASASGPQPCDDGGVVELDFKTNPKVDLALRTDCLSPSITLPFGATWRIHTPGGPDDLWEYFFWNGERSLARDGGWRTPSIAHSRFRLRATKQDTTATIMIEPS